MRQGSASYTMDQKKREPSARAVSPVGVSQIGQNLGNHITDSSKILNPNAISRPLYKGRGFEAPKDEGRDIYRSGSQKRSD